MLTACIFLFCIGMLYYSLVGFEGKEYYLFSLVIVLAGVILFLVHFERRKPSVAELSILAVMTAFAVVARISFFFFPQIKPVLAVVIICGISMGAESGFISGALCAFVSNFYFGQGSWTPFQMFALGVVGFLAGVLFRRIPVNAGTLSIYGVLSAVVIYGGIVDLNTLFFFTGSNTWQAVKAVYGAGFVFNLILGVSTAGFLILLHRPMLAKLSRVKIKFQLMEDSYE